VIFFDFRPGVTFSLLLKAVAETSGNASALLQEAKPGPDPPLAPLLAEAWGKPTVDEIILAMRKSCTDKPPVQVKPAGNEISAILALAGPEPIDLFEFSAYISLSVLLAQGETMRRLLKPGVGADSPEKVFSILQNTAMTITPEAKAISPFLAAFLMTRFAPFADRAGGGGFAKAVSFADPAEPEAIVRVFFYEDPGASADEVAVIEANLDDMTPEILSQAMQLTLENGALDYTVTPVGMKKGRPGFRVEVLARLEDREKIEELLLLHTSTFGVRTTLAERRILERSTEYFQSSYGRLRVKRGFYRGKLVRTVPEYEDLAAIGAQRGIPLIRLYADVMAEIARKSS
jgi:hypothetical protein